MQNRIYFLLLIALCMLAIPLGAQEDETTNPVTLRFGVRVELPDPRLMNDFVETFAAENPAIDEVIWEQGGGTGFDCGTTNAQGHFSADETLDLAPLLAADADFDETAYLTGIFDGVTTTDGMIQGLPLVFLPEALWIDVVAFEDAGLPLPRNGWTVDEFSIALNTLDATELIEIPDSLRLYSNRHILLLTGSLGGLPLDYRTTPPTPQFTTPQTVTALQAISNLVLQNALDYSPLFTLDVIRRTANTATSAPIQIEQVGLGGRRLLPERFNAGEGYIVAPYPTNPDGPAVVSYSTISGTINASTDYANACYQLLRELGNRPDVFLSPPARLDLVDDPAFLESDVVVLAEYITAFEAKISATDTPAVVVPPFYEDANFWPNQWFNRAFDQIIGGSTPANALTVAQSHTEAYYICMEPVLNASTLPADELQQAVSACAQAVDPDGYVLLFGENAGD